MGRDLGDFQTPPELVTAILQSPDLAGRRWSRAFEPTCGCGNFISGLLSLPSPPREIQAVELQDVHFERARWLAEGCSASRIVIHKANIFDLDLSRDLRWVESGPLLVLGNPPWVTNSALGALGSSNLPRKYNLKSLRGIDALTGASNFDIAEYIWIKLITELVRERPTIALLCKTSVARNVLKFAALAHLPIRRALIRKIDAKKWFGVTVEACLFCLEIDPGAPRYEAAVYRDLYETKPEAVICVVGGRLVADAEAYSRSSFVDGICPATWRQGIKHDAASVMELISDGSGDLRNKKGEIVVVEPEYIYPLLKGSDLFRLADLRPAKRVIVTQKRLGEDTNRLKSVAPRLWDYLTAHADEFARRKSSVYKGQPPFAMFGVGDYAFAPYKVAVSGLYKTPRFRIVGPADGRPVMLDDTCYYVACRLPEEAAFLAALLSDPLCLDFIRSTVFTDSKRPITKELLARIDLAAVFERCDRDALTTRAAAELERLGIAADRVKKIWFTLEELPTEWFSGDDGGTPGASTEIRRVVQLRLALR